MWCSNGALSAEMASFGSTVLRPAAIHGPHLAIDSLLATTEQRLLFCIVQFFSKLSVRLCWRQQFSRGFLPRYPGCADAPCPAPGGS